MKQLSMVAVLAVGTVASALNFEPGQIIGSLSSTIVDEASGFAFSKLNDGIIYANNDSGGGSYAYAFTTNGLLKVRFFLDGANNRDYEDIAVAIDPATSHPHVYVANSGDNNQVRTEIFVHRFPEPVITAGQAYADVSTSVTTYKFVYPVAARDCETFFVDPDTGDFYFITKRDAKSRIYRSAYPQSTSSDNVLEYLGDMQVSNLTGGDISPDGRFILVKNYAEVYLFDRDDSLSIVDALLGAPTTVSYTPEPKGESITFDVNTLGYYTTTEGVTAPVYYYASTDLPVEPPAADATPFVEGVVAGTVSLSSLDEISGLAASAVTPGVLFGMNDSGGGNYAYAMNTQGGVLARYTLNGADARDYEDIAVAIDPNLGVPFVYVANIGDNNAVRSEVQIIRFAEPAVDPSQSYSISTVFPLTYRIQYPDGARDAESFFVDPATGDFYFLTKRDAKSRIYRAAYPQSTSSINTLEFLGEMSVTGLTAADISADGSEILAKTYSQVFFFEREAGESIVDALLGDYAVAPYTPEVKGEAICFERSAPNGYYTTTEGSNVDLSYYGRLVPPAPEAINFALHIGQSADVSIADNSAGTLSFALAAGAPAGVSIDAVTGILSFVPGMSLAGQAVDITVLVTDTDNALLSYSRDVSVAVGAPLQLEVVKANSGLNLTWNSVPGAGYRVEICTSLGQSWQVVAEVAAADTLTTVFDESPSIPTIHRCFFRVVPM